MKMLKLICVAVLAVLGVGLLLLLGLIGVSLNNTLRLAEDSTAFQVLQADAKFNVLVAGDSTGVGTGAALPSASVAGQLAQNYHCASVVNRSRDSALTRDVVAQLRGTGDSGFELGVIQIGANDVLRLTEFNNLKRAMENALARASSLADRVVLLDTSNVSNAPVFLPPFDRLYARRAQIVRRMLMEAAAAAGVTYVDLAEPSVAEAFERSPDRYYAADGLHPNGEGYRLWYRALMQQSQLESVLNC